MAATIVDLFEEIKIVRQKLDDLAIRLITGEQISAPSGLSEISISLGLVSAGEFRAGNNLAPGEGFNGVRIGYPGFYYPSTSVASSDYYHIVGVEADTLTFGIRSSDGVAVFGYGGLASGIELNQSGIVIGNDPSTTNASLNGIFFRNASGLSSSSDGASIGYNADHTMVLSNEEVGVDQGFKMRIVDSDGAAPYMQWKVDSGTVKTRLILLETSFGAEFAVGNGAAFWAQANSDSAGYLDIADGGSTLAGPANGYGRLYTRDGNLRFISTDGVDYQLNTT